MPTNETINQKSVFDNYDKHKQKPVMSKDIIRKFHNI